MAYTYLIGWSHSKKYYYGVRFSKKSSPDDLWKKYFTSSKLVKKYREENGEPDIIQVRKTFDDAEKARLWEWKVLQRMKVAHKEEWLNLCDQKAIPSMIGENNPMRRPEVYNKHLNAVRNENRIKKLKETLKGHKKSSTENYFKPKSEEHSKAISHAASNRERLNCEKCNQGYTKANFNKHFVSCNGKIQLMYKKHEDGKVRRILNNE